MADDLTPPTWLTAAFVAVITTLAGVVAYLFRRSDRKDDEREKAIAAEREAMDKERAAWAVERERLRADYEEKCNELSIEYAKALREDARAARDHEDQIRREFAEIMEGISSEAREASKALVEMLQKFYERFVGRSARY